MQWFSEAPANIALIKYMGKRDPQNNTADNPSLSYTLTQLLTRVTLETRSDQHDYWEPLITPTDQTLTLTQAAQQRFLNHLNQIKSYFNYTGGFTVQSSNNFPHSSGLASSASSFAALTRCAVQALAELTQTPIPTIEEQARLSRLGSGSSCRSFFTPWALWDNDRVTPIDLPYQHLEHQVIIVSRAEKKIASGAAHQLVKTSPLYTTRTERAQNNLKALLQAFNEKNWGLAHTIVWQEFQDMHALFHTSQTPFSYINSECENLLNALQDLWHHHGDGPLVTMDAGPNIHLLYRDDQHELAMQFKKDHLTGHYDVL